MNPIDCILALEALGYTFELTADGRVLARLLGGIPPPVEAGPMLAYLKAHRAEVIAELRARAAEPPPDTEPADAPKRRAMPGLLEMYIVKAVASAGLIEIVRIEVQQKSNQAEAVYRPVIPDEWVQVEWGCFVEVAKDLMRAEMADMRRQLWESPDLGDTLAPKYADFKRALGEL